MQQEFLLLGNYTFLTPGLPKPQLAENKWRKRVGVEPTGDGVTRRPPVLKTGTITGPHALPQTATDHRRLSRSEPGFRRKAQRTIRANPCKSGAHLGCGTILR